MYQQNKYKRTRALILSSLAIILAWYNFLIFGFYAVFISKLFFPFQDQTTSIVTTFLVFGISFLFRPLGALIISRIGDKHGRKKAFITTITLMAFPTFLIGILPTYEEIGIAASILIIFLRILQGISIGGERGGTLSILIEMAPDNSRGFYSVFAGFSTMFGIILASTICGVITIIFDSKEMLEFAWRIPFLLGIFTGLMGYYLRKHLEESTKFLQVKSNNLIPERPIHEALINYWKRILLTLFATLIFAAAFYSVFVYLITFSVTNGKTELSSILTLNTVNMLLITILLPLCGYFSDKVGRKPLMITGAIGIAVTSIFIFRIFSGDDYISKFLIQFIAGIFLIIYAAGLFAFMVELFPTRIRMTAISLGHVMGFSIFGGSAPFLLSYLIEKTGNSQSAAYYLIICSGISLITVLLSKETYRAELE